MAVLCAMTKLPGIRERSVVMSWFRPSAKWSCSESLLRFSKGKTTIERLGAGDSCGAFEFGWNHKAITAPPTKSSKAIAALLPIRPDRDDGAAGGFSDGGGRRDTASADRANK